MSDATLAHFGNRIRGIGAIIQELPIADSNGKKSFLGLLLEVRADLLVLGRMIDRMIEDQGDAPAIPSGRAEKPSEALQSLVKKTDESIKGLSDIREKLFKSASRSLLGRVYVSRAIAPLISSTIDKLHDLAGAFESMIGNDGEFISGSELLKRIG